MRTGSGQPAAPEPVRARACLPGEAEHLISVSRHLALPAVSLHFLVCKVGTLFPLGLLR